MKGSRLVRFVVGVMIPVLTIGCSGLPGSGRGSNLLQAPYKEAGVPNGDLSDLTLEQQEILLQTVPSLVDGPYPRMEEALQILGGLGKIKEGNQIIKDYASRIDAKTCDIVGYMGIINFYDNKYNEKNNPLTETALPAIGN